jgi:acetate---CoA ligase (ADP-forming)
MLSQALDPRSVAVIGASDNPHKIGGRPILYMKRYGFRGAIYPVNPAREQVQGLTAYPDIDTLPDTPDLVVVAVAGEEALRAVQACARRGVRAAVVMASGFGETGEAGRRAQDEMLAAARAAGMRLIGPNCQGLANFATGVVANFSTIFHEVEARDGPVAIVSQSGANSQAIYSLVYEKGLGARHVHATGNEADVTVADLAAAIVEDPGVRLMLLYMEAIKDPNTLAQAAERARSRDLPIIALKAGRTASGQKAASSHTGALAAEDRVVDAFFERHGIWRAADPHELVLAAELYLSGRRPRGKRLAVISNSGASCVMAADFADERNIPLSKVSARAREQLAKILPAFAALDNPIDITGALLSNPKLFGAVLPVVGEDAQSDLVMVALPVAGMGYDVPGFAADLSKFAGQYDQAVALAAPQAAVRAEFAKQGIATFARERDAILALEQLAQHSELLRRKPLPPRGMQWAFPEGNERFMNEAESLALIANIGIPVIEHRLCKTEEEARSAQAELGDVALKACSRDVPHKNRHGLVALHVADAAGEFRRQRDGVLAIGARFEGVLVARMAGRGRELALGARVDPQFGPVVLVGDGGIHMELLKDFALLMPPIDVNEVLAKLKRLRIAPLLAGLDLANFADMAVRLGEAALAWREAVASIDVNPVMLFETGSGAVALDALVERAAIIPA